MNYQFDELARGLAQFVKRALAFLCLAIAVPFGELARANDFQRGPLALLSSPDPLAGCNLGGAVLKHTTRDAAVEPYLAINPANAGNIVVAWIAHDFHGNVAGATLDGGTTWQQVTLPGISRCTGGAQPYSADPWLSFAPNGVIYSLNIGWGSDPGGIYVSKSADGGRNWSDPTLINSGDGDKGSITADPANASYVYAVWVGFSGAGASTQFARTTDGGRSWEPARSIYALPGNNLAWGHQLKVLPDGTLVCLFTELHATTVVKKVQQFDYVFSVQRSSDKGLTWSGPIRAAAQLPLVDPTASPPNALVTDPDTGHTVEAHPMFPSVAVDAKSGNLYAVWIDARFSNGQYNGIAFSQSTDGGLNWSEPIRVNQTPNDIAPANRQAWNPSVAAASDGTVAVTYYDFRFNDSGPGALTDYWLVHCHPSNGKPATDPANWGSEVRLSDGSFDLEQAPTRFDDAYFLGDYEGLAGAGNGFVAVWTQPLGSNADQILFRRVGP